jgi:hypothetical protein
MEKMNMNKIIVDNEPLMSYKVIETEEGFICSVRAHGKSVNEWNLGKNEEIAQAKTATIIDSYEKGLEYVQSQVRTIFAEEEEGK